MFSKQKKNPSLMPNDIAEIMKDNSPIEIVSRSFSSTVNVVLKTEADNTSTEQQKKFHCSEV